MLLDRVAIELVERRIEMINEPITAEVAGEPWTRSTAHFRV